MGVRSNIVSRTIDFLRFPMAVMVVYIHNFTLFDIPYTIDWYHFDGMSIYNLIRVYVSLVLTHIAVPAFFLISGFLLFKGLEEWNWKVYYGKLRNRFRSLLIPYLTWIIIALAIGVSIKCLSLWHHHSDFSELYSWVEENVRLSSFWNIKEWNASRLNWLGYPVPASAPYLIPLWFIRDLLVMVIIAPLFYYLMRQSGGGQNIYYCLVP